MVFYGRFFKSRLNWVRVHFIGQSVGAVLVLGFFIVILLNFQAWDQPHAALGMVLLSCLVMQVSLGVANRVRMLRDIGGIARVIKIAHALLGSVMLLAAVAQVALGLNILYPWIEAARGRPIWYTYFALVALWIILFVSTEGFFVTRIRLRKAFAHDRKRRLFTPDQLVEAEAARYSKKYTSGVPLQDMAKKKEDNMGYVGTVAPKVVPEMPLERLEGFQHEKAQETMMRTFTWADIAAEVSGGRLLVIANGKYVYDASVWLYSHPGGSIVLHSVAGTDISFDFFRESGFDADDFKPALPVEPMRHSNLPVQGEGGDNAGRTRAARPLSQPIPVADSQQHSLTQSDWRLILKARRTNVHSFNAIKRLASFMVGTIAADSSPSDEYRRYAITAKTVVSRDGAHSPTYLIRLGLLYPTRESMQEPCFQAGDAVELQVRVGDQVVSRYYTPIGGNPVAFEILVKVKPGGVVSRWLAGQKVGDRQIKVRGPIGRRLLMPPDARRFSLGLGAEVPREIVFFAGGTGISPFLQLVNNLLLPLGATVPVVATYLPQAPDEVELWPGDVVQVYHHYMDGWARGVNLTTGTFFVNALPNLYLRAKHCRTGQDGMLPLTFTNPNAGSHFKLILIASAASLSEALGVETLHAALLAYPHQIEVHWAIGHHLAAGSPIRASVIDDGAQFGRHQGSLCGYLYDQPINSELVEYVLADARSRPPPGEALAEVGEGDGMLTRVGSVDRGSGMVVACGPDGYCHRVTEIVKQVDGLRGANIAVMGAERVLVSW
ncbi:hypothetical protein HK101_002034 [Irineochytrium annulatum]|nr:hypothetical protein HK101_002034 [Irineochytrium annulatum]